MRRLFMIANKSREKRWKKKEGKLKDKCIIDLSQKFILILFSLLFATELQWTAGVQSSILSILSHQTRSLYERRQIFNTFYKGSEIYISLNSTSSIISSKLRQLRFRQDELLLRTWIEMRHCFKARRDLFCQAA